jgi:hypothetical protein
MLQNKLLEVFQFSVADEEISCLNLYLGTYYSLRLLVFHFF